MHYRTFIAAAPIAALLATTAALAPTASASPMAPGPTVPIAQQPANTLTWVYVVEADWVRIHTRPSASSTTKALARKFDGSLRMPQPAPQANGFTLFADHNNGVTGWVSTAYIEELFCDNNECQ